MKRLLITGGSSYLGQHLVPKALKRYDCCYTYFNQDPLHLPNGIWLDMRDRRPVMDLVQEWMPELIIHTAGSNRSEDMERVISAGSENIVEAAELAGARLIHISSDVIFDGLGAPYGEDDPPHPIHAYGKAKAAAEETVSAYEDHVIVRTSLIYGLGIMDLSTRWIMETANMGGQITLFTDQLRSPIWAESLSLACLELCELKFTGIINIAGRQAQTRAELGFKLLEWWDFDHSDAVRTGLTDGPWPRDCRLDVSLAQEILSTPLVGIDEILGRRL